MHFQADRIAADYRPNMHNARTVSLDRIYQYVRIIKVSHAVSCMGATVLD